MGLAVSPECEEQYNIRYLFEHHEYYIDINEFLPFWLVSSRRDSDKTLERIISFSIAITTKAHIPSFAAFILQLNRGVWYNYTKPVRNFLTNGFVNTHDRGTNAFNFASAVYCVEKKKKYSLIVTTISVN